MGSDRSFSERFELKSQAGTGGMGTVYQALDRVTGELVALKVLQARGLTDAARFDQEAALLRELRHPGIVRFVDHGITGNGDPFIAMEWLEGETLERRLFRGALPPRAVALLGQRILEALAAAHVKGVVHRDIKPSNIYLVRWRLDDIRILDFGIARRVFDPRRFTRVGSMVGTPLYTAPEQARGSRDVDGRADVFSLGCVLFEAIAGTPPFRGDTPQDVMAMICTGQVPDVRSRCPGIDLELAALLQSMLTQDKSLRPGDAVVLAQKFERLAGRLGSPLELEPPAPQMVEARPALGEDERRVVVAVRVRFDNPGADDAARRARAELRLRARELVAGVGVRIDRLPDESLVMTPASPGPPADQAELLARAAVKLRDALPQAHYGMAMGRAAMLEHTPVGPLTDRLMALPAGERGAIVLDAAVARLLRGRFSLWEERRNIFLLAAAERSVVFEPTGSQEAASGGRDRELRSLLSLCEESAAEEVARAALVVGGPGMGKTELRRALRARLGGAASGAHVITVRVRGHEVGQPGGCVRSIPGLFASDAPPVTAAATEARLLAWLDERLRAAPLVLLIEDLHEADQPSLAMLDTALRVRATQPLAVIGFARPEIDDLQPSLWKARNVERLRLLPLPRRAGQALIAAWLPERSTEVENFLLERWEGNPFFLRELTGAVGERSKQIPEAVLGTVEARLNCVTEEARRVLRAASLFGEACTAEGLATLLGDGAATELEVLLPILCDREFLRAEAGSDGGPDEYRFTSPLLQEACLEMLTPSDRKVGVRLARRWLENLDKTLPHSLVDTAARAALGVPN